MQIVGRVGADDFVRGIFHHYLVVMLFSNEVTANEISVKNSLITVDYQAIQVSVAL